MKKDVKTGLLIRFLCPRNHERKAVPNQINCVLEKMFSEISYAVSPSEA